MSHAHDDGLQIKYFVLKPEGIDWHAEASRAALKAYAESCKDEKPLLAMNLLNWVDMEQNAADYEEQLLRGNQP